MIAIGKILGEKAGVLAGAGDGASSSLSSNQLIGKANVFDTHNVKHIFNKLYYRNILHSTCVFQVGTSQKKSH